MVSHNIVYHTCCSKVHYTMLRHNRLWCYAILRHVIRYSIAIHGDVPRFGNERVIAVEGIAGATCGTAQLLPGKWRQGHRAERSSARARRCLSRRLRQPLIKCVGAATQTLCTYKVVYVGKAGNHDTWGKRAVKRVFLNPTPLDDPYLDSSLYDPLRRRSD